MSLRDIVEELASVRNPLPLPETHTLRLCIGDIPGYRLLKTISVFRSEIEDILSRPLEFSGGGCDDKGHPYVQIDLENMPLDEIEGLSRFVSRPEHQQYFKDRFLIHSVEVVTR